MSRHTDYLIERYHNLDIDRVVYYMSSHQAFVRFTDESDGRFGWEILR